MFWSDFLDLLLEVLKWLLVFAALAFMFIHSWTIASVLICMAVFCGVQQIVLQCRVRQ